MANFNTYYRSNYFKVKDEEKLKEITEGMGAELWSKEVVDTLTDETETYYAFGNDTGEGWELYYNEKGDDLEEVDTASIISDILEHDQICVVNLIGHEKLRYLAAESTIITTDEIDYIDHFGKLKKTISPIMKCKVNKEFEY